MFLLKMILFVIVICSIVFICTTIAEFFDFKSNIRNLHQYGVGDIEKLKKHYNNVKWEADSKKLTGETYGSYYGNPYVCTPTSIKLGGKYMDLGFVDYIKYRIFLVTEIDKAKKTANKKKNSIEW